MHPIAIYKKKEPWNKGKLVGQKLTLKQKQIWAIRIRLEISAPKVSLLTSTTNISQIFSTLPMILTQHSR